MLKYTRSASGFLLAQFTQRSADMTPLKDSETLWSSGCLCISFSESRRSCPFPSPGPWATHSCHWASLSHCLPLVWPKALLWDALWLTCRALMWSRHKPCLETPLKVHMVGLLSTTFPKTGSWMGRKKAYCEDLSESKLSSFTWNSSP